MQKETILDRIIAIYIAPCFMVSYHTGETKITPEILHDLPEKI